MAQPKTAPTANENTETTEAPAVREAFSFNGITDKNSKELAEAIWAHIDGENYAERHDKLQTLFEQIRAARDANKTTRPRKELNVILQEAIGKPMGELQASKVDLGGISVAIPQIVKLASSKDVGPMNAMAVDFLKTHKLKIVKKKVSSKGKESTFLEAA